MDEVHKISSELEWRGYGDFTLFRDTDTKIAQHEAHLADLSHTDETLVIRAKHVYALAGLYWAKHDYDESFEYFQQAARLAERLEDAPFQSWCYNGMGDVYAETGRHDEAIAAYRHALTFDATSACSHLGLGWVYGDLLGRYEEAIAAYQRAIELDGLVAHLVSIAHNGLGSIYYALGCYEEAIAAYQRAIEADPGFLSPYDNLGAIFMKQRAFPEARYHFEERIRLRPQHSLGAYVSLGIMARHAGDPESDAYFRRALESFEAAWKARYDTPAGFLEKKALALIGLGRCEEALRTLREALAQRAPGDAIEFFRYELLRTAPNPPDGIDEMIAMLRQTEGASSV